MEYEEGNGLGRVEAREKVAWAADSTESASHESVEVGEEDSGDGAGAV